MVIKIGKNQSSISVEGQNHMCKFSN